MNMEFIIIPIILIITYIFLIKVFKISVKEIKKFTINDELDEITKKYPKDEEICRKILDKIGNKNVNIQKDKESNSTMYFVAGNKIFIGETKNSYARIQTIAHECLHSIQDKTLLWTNFIYSNIYNLFFVIVSIFAITKVLKYRMMFLVILLIMGLIYYVIRSYLENDAMIKARFLAKDYMIEENISSKEEIDKIVRQYDKLNNVGIKFTNVKLALSVYIKCLIFAVICYIN